MNDTDIRARWMRESLAPYAAAEPRSSGSTKLSVSLPTDLVEVVRATATRSGMSVSAMIAASLRQTLVVAEQESLDRALALDAEEDREWAAATGEVHARLVSELEW
jgi:transcriptional regulator of met regulon